MQNVSGEDLFSFQIVRARSILPRFCFSPLHPFSAIACCHSVSRNEQLSLKLRKTRQFADYQSCEKHVA